MAWNFADMWESVSDAIPDNVVLIQGDRRVTWRQFDDRAARLAAAFTAAGLQAGLEGRVVSLQQQRVQRGRVRDVQAARRARERELPLPRGRAGVPPRQLRRRGAAVPRRARRRVAKVHAPGDRREALDPGRRRRAAPGLRGRLRGAHRRARPDAAHRAQRRRPLLPVHRRHHGHAEGRDVAQRGPHQGARRRRVRARRARAGHRSRTRRARSRPRSSPKASSACTCPRRR